MARAVLSRERVLDAALRLADQGGIEALSMRRLARELGVEAMSLYNHVASKGDLVDAIVEVVVGEIELPEDEEDWDAAVRAWAISAHGVFLRHPWACSLVMSPGSDGNVAAPRLQYMEWLLGRLRRAGFPAELTYHAYHALDAHVLGFTLWQLGHAAGAKAFAGGEDVGAVAARILPGLRERGYPHVAEHAEQHLAAGDGEGAREFAFGLELILAGLARARAASADPVA